MNVTVAIPVYNGEKYLHEAITGVLAQTYEDFELLLVDNASTDRTRSIIASFDDPRIRYVRNPHNIGIHKNFTKCLSLASGKYILFHGADDSLMPEFLNETVPLLEKDEDLSCVGTNLRIIDEKGTPGPLFFTYTNTDILFTREEFLEQYFRRYSMSLASTIIRTDLLKRNRITFYEKYGRSSDMVLWIQLALCSKKLCFLHTPFAFRRIHKEQESNKFRGHEYCQDYLIKTQAHILLALIESNLEDSVKMVYIEKILSGVRATVFDMPLMKHKDIVRAFRKKVESSLRSIGVCLRQDKLVAYKL